ncbi:polysaccharide deacetylase [Candidatus Omnitrophus magneticus]|uniref:Polysaccharide deacetylase n=1 Tax=Candidatus Omnitrophus magneticus TaxID=1609969 RepID=A0A0F0CNG3_9BACT|nr:polysaccharide deacetylase [Candidatus Omnitrophus magneticus]KJJ84868.1 polysaccharide deacetylase [Candidatus Omnitrophus magneticus]
MLKKIIFIFLLCYLCVLETTYATTEKNINNKTIIVILRCDDYSSVSSFFMEARILNILLDKKIPCVFGIVPYVCQFDFEDTMNQEKIPLSHEKIDTIKNAIESGIIEPALHGYSHQTIFNKKTGILSEFYGVSYAKQVENIRAGRDFLEGILGRKINIFIPPWNSFDDNTVRALENLDFECLSGGIDYSISERSSLKILPETCTLPQLKNAILTARETSSYNPIIVAYFHANSFLNDNPNGDITFENFERLLDWISAQPDVKIMTMKETINTVQDLSAKRFCKYISYIHSFSLLPVFIQPSDQFLYRAPGMFWNARVLFWRVLTGIFYFSIMGIFFLAGILLGDGIRERRGLLYFILIKGGFLILICTIVYALKNLSIGFKGAVSIAAVFGGYGGIFLAAKKDPRAIFKHLIIKDSGID